VRPKLSDTDKRTVKLIIRLTKTEKLRLQNLTKQGKYACMSDYMRNRIFDLSKRKTISLDDEAKNELKSLDYELNKIGVNLNQLSKRMNSFSPSLKAEAIGACSEATFIFVERCACNTVTSL